MLFAIAMLALMAGCLERKIQVTSEPPGAAVWLNDVEVGRTPLTTGFKYYGEYDVRLKKDGYEPLWTHRAARTTFAEAPPIDLFATALPVTIENQVNWHFDLQPTPPETIEPLVERAREFRARAVSNP